MQSSMKFNESGKYYLGNIASTQVRSAT